MSQIRRTIGAQRPCARREAARFDEALYEWMQRTPWLALSALAHALVAAILMAIPWELLKREDPRPIQVSVAELPREPFEQPLREPEDVVEPLAEPDNEPRLVEDAAVDDATVEDPTDRAEPAVGEFLDEFPDTDPAALHALGLGGGGSGGSGHLAGARGRAHGLGRGSEGAVQSGLAWLRDHQAPDGHWSCAGFMHDNALERTCACDGPGLEVHDVGVTGLALLAFLGDGNTTRQGPYKENVSRGINWLREQQDKDTGQIGDRFGHGFIYDHAIATLAITEAYYFSRNPLIRTSAQDAVNYILRARNPYSAWRYEVPPDGESDTSVTGWMVLVLTSADESGLTVDRSAYAAALAWLDEVSDHVTGRAGYVARGTLSARIPGVNDRFPPERGEAMTAVALLSRFLLGQVPRALGGSDGIMDLHAALLVERLPAPAPDDLGPDLYYWYYGSYAMHQMGGERHWERWRRALEEVLPPAQRRDGDAAGSWDPDGPWGSFGGRVYSTSLALLTLEVPVRYARVVPAPGAPEPKRRRR